MYCEAIRASQSISQVLQLRANPRRLGSRRCENNHVPTDVVARGGQLKSVCHTLGVLKFCAAVLDAGKTAVAEISIAVNNANDKVAAQKWAAVNHKSVAC